MFGQKKMAALLAEFLGAGLLSLVFYTMLARTSFPLFSGLAAGLMVGTLVLVIGNVSGAHINPAVTVSLWMMRKIDTAKAVVYIAAQMLGGLAAWGLLTYFIGHTLTSMAGTKFDGRVLIAEGVGTAVFAFGTTAAMVQKFDVGRTALITGGSFMLGVLVASLASTGILNPAVAVGIRSWDWAYAVGPLAGAIVGSNLYAALNAASANKLKAKLR